MLQKQPPEVFYKKGILKNFTNLTETPGLESLFYKVADLHGNYIKRTMQHDIFQSIMINFYKNLF